MTASHNYLNTYRERYNVCALIKSGFCNFDNQIKKSFQTDCRFNIVCCLKWKFDKYNIENCVNKINSKSCEKPQSKQSNKEIKQNS